MRRQHIVIAALALFGGLTTAAFGALLAINPAWLPWAEPNPAISTVAKPAPMEQATRESARQPTPASGPLVDFMRIAPGGISVLAGRGTPGTSVTIYESGRQVGTAKVDGNGEWSMATEFAFGSDEPKVTIREGTPRPLAAAAPPPVTAPDARQNVEGRPNSVAAVEKKVLRDLEAAVAAAKAPPGLRPDEQAARLPARVASANPGTAGLSVTGSAPAPGDPEPLIAAPVPITFVYREAKPTPLGEQAARLLVEYIRLKGIRALELTGHADERGTDEFNMQLSQQRLETVAQLLKSAGYDGELTLTPRGRAEPYRAVDRTRLTLEDLYQLDRRVELRAAR